MSSGVQAPHRGHGLAIDIGGLKPSWSAATRPRWAPIADFAGSRAPAA